MKLPFMSMQITLSSISIFVPLVAEDSLPFSQQDGICISFPHTHLGASFVEGGEYSLTFLTKGIDTYTKSINGKIKSKVR